MHLFVKHAARIVAALSEPVALKVGLLLLFGWILSFHWREWIDLPTADSTAPHAVLLGILLIVNRCLRRRYDVLLFRAPPRSARAVGWFFTLGVAASIPLALITGADRLADRHTLALITPLPLIASLLPIFSAALMEELIHRRAVMGCLARLGAPLLLALTVQAFLFVLAHGKGALLSFDRFSWLFTGGLLLGTMYVATRSLWSVVLCHSLLNLGLAQTQPRWNWYTHRLIEEISVDWTAPLMPIWLLSIAAYWIWRFRRSPFDPDLDLGPRETAPAHRWRTSPPK